MKFEQVLPYLMNGKPVTRKFWGDECWVRYAELFDTFVMHANGESHAIDGIKFDPECFLADDWTYGEYHPVREEITWIPIQS